jgi:hypothetical protein
VNITGDKSKMGTEKETKKKLYKEEEERNR